MNAFCFFGGLKDKIQSELDKNPFIAKQNLKLRVTEEKRGYVTIDIYEGDRALRNAIHKRNGKIFSGDHLRNQALYDDGPNKEAVRVMISAIEIVRKMDGVKEISLTAPINTPADQSDDLLKQAIELYKEKKYSEHVLPLIKSAELGNDTAQRLLSNHYYNGDRGAQKDFKMTKYWLEKAVLKGDPRAYNAMAWFLAVCPDSKYQNGKKAAEYAQKAISQDNTRWYFHGTLAAAYARNGKYRDAISSQEKAIILLTEIKPKVKEFDKYMQESKMRLDLYKKGKPFTDE